MRRAHSSERGARTPHPIGNEVATNEMTDQEEVDRLEKLWRRGQDAGLDRGTPDDRTLFRALTSKLARLYSKVVVNRVYPGNDK